MNPPPNLTPEENEKRVVEFRKRLGATSWAKSVFRLFYLVPCVVPFAVGLLRLLNLPNPFPPIVWFPILVGTLSLFPAYTFWMQKRVREIENAGWQKAFEDNVLLPLNLLIDACRMLKGDLQRTAEERLVTALNTSQAAEYTQLSEKDKRWLLVRLEDGMPALPDAMLKVVEKYGGKETLGVLKRLIQGDDTKPRFTEDKNPYERISVTAKRLLSIVEARVEAAKRGETLLRPSVPPISPDEFLRPSQNIPSAEDATQLLRASVGETEE